ARHLDVEEHQVGPVPFDRFDGLDAVRRLADDLHSRHLAEEPDQAVPRELLVVDDERTDGLHQAASGRRSVVGSLSSTRVPPPGVLVISGRCAGPYRRSRRARRLWRPTPRSKTSASTADDMPKP